MATSLSKHAHEYSTNISSDKLINSCRLHCSINTEFFMIEFSTPWEAVVDEAIVTQARIVTAFDKVPLV